MKQLTDAERLEVAMGILDERQVNEYAEQCRELELEQEQDWQGSDDGCLC